MTYYICIHGRIPYLSIDELAELVHQSLALSGSLIKLEVNMLDSLQINTANFLLRSFSLKECLQNSTC